MSSFSASQHHSKLILNRRTQSYIPSSDRMRRDQIPEKRKKTSWILSLLSSHLNLGTAQHTRRPLVITVQHLYPWLYFFSAFLMIFLVFMVLLQKIKLFPLGVLGHTFPQSEQWLTAGTEWGDMSLRCRMCCYCSLILQCMQHFVF
jgi:hypothetical protein